MLAHWKESYDQPRQQIHYFANKGASSQKPVVMDGCESWIIKKAEHQRTDAFEIWVLLKTLQSPGLQGNQTSQS